MDGLVERSIPRARKGGPVRAVYDPRMNALDIGLVVVAGVLVVLGLAKGFVRLLVAVAALVVAFLLASRFHRALADHWSASRVPPEVLRLAAYLAIFVGVMLVGALLAWLLRNLLKAAMLGWADRLAGAALGLLAAILAGALVILPLAAYSPGGSRLLQGSKLAPYVSAVADLVNTISPADLAERYRAGIERARRWWRGEAEPLLEKVKGKARSSGVRDGKKP